MAMYESLGFCPANDFATIEGTNSLVSAIRESLGARTGYMVYAKNGFAWGNKIPSVVDALLNGDDGILGIKISTYLSSIIPECIYNKVGKMILIEDFINPFQMVDDLYYDYNGDENHKFSFYGDEGYVLFDSPVMVKNGVRLFYDDRYLIAIENGEDTVTMKIFKLPPV